MEKIYTIEQFKKLFEKAEKETLEELEAEFTESQEELNGNSKMRDFMFALQNKIVTATLKHNLFEGEE